MSAWDESQWIDYDAEVINVFSSGTHAWIEYRYSVWYVGWRRLRVDDQHQLVQLLGVATAAKANRWTVRVRATASGGPGGLAEITAIQTK
ncbi:hypothetical protein QUV83_04480 [Cellulomonas cellasea]|uniref:hypothetical protein n=1 Tax=Cellulomonas cellasea TaxID=43670 RepID=UPI0025A452C0|nr:hypothetical protein [Cellulomonas cellasea]MDM8084018.1 hypothetical protein [Cellulomonas cellasea]